LCTNTVIVTGLIATTWRHHYCPYYYYYLHLFLSILFTFNAASINT